MHVDLSPANKIKILEAAGKLNMSPNRAANLFLDAVELSELVQLIAVKSTLPSSVHPPDVPRVMRRKTRIVIGE